MSERISFDLGALAPHIGEQIPGLPPEKAEVIEAHRVAINRLRINGLLTRSEAQKAEKRLVKEIQEALE